MPLALPKVTVLFSRPEHDDSELAGLIGAEDEDLANYPLTESLDAAYRAMFWDADERPDRAPKIGDWHTQFSAFLRGLLGPTAVAARCLANARAEGFDDIFPRILITSVSRIEDVNWLASQFRHEDFLVVHLGSLTKTPTNGTRIIWIPVPGAQQQMDFLRRELETHRDESAR